MPLTFERPIFDCVDIIILYKEVLLSSHLLHVFIYSFYMFSLFHSTLTFVLCSKTHLPPCIHSWIHKNRHRHVAWHILTHSYMHSHMGKQTCSTFIFSFCFISSRVVRQPIFALACCYLRGSWKVVMEGWLRPVTSCSFTPGTLSGKVMAKPARCSSHF